MTTRPSKTLTEQLQLLEGLTSIHLDPYGSWPESVHQFDADSINALKVALAARRPLLLRGEPGSGKSQLARAAAAVLNRMFVYEVVNAHMESRDLLYRFDAVRRLAEAQCLQGAGCSTELRKDVLDMKKYVSPGPFWWALDWKTADETYTKSSYQLARPEKLETWQQEDGCVILIDEIDKANAELPNGLLEILGNNAVRLPFLKETLGNGADRPAPLVIITTNEERELPGAFVRRCLVLNLALPEDRELFIASMVDRGLLHYGANCSGKVCLEAAKQLWRDREKAINDGVANPPGQAEYLDILRALSALVKDDETEQLKLLEKIAKFAFDKYPAQYNR